MSKGGRGDAHSRKSPRRIPRTPHTPRTVWFNDSDTVVGGGQGAPTSAARSRACGVERTGAARQETDRSPS